MPAAGIGYPQGAAGVVEVRYLGPAVYRRNAAGEWLLMIDSWSTHEP